MQWCVSFLNWPVCLSCRVRPIIGLIGITNTDTDKRYRYQFDIPISVSVWYEFLNSYRYRHGGYRYRYGYDHMVDPYGLAYLIATGNSSLFILTLHLVKASLAVVIIDTIFIFKRLWGQDLLLLVVHHGVVLLLWWPVGGGGLVSSGGGSCGGSKKEELEIKRERLKNVILLFLLKNS